MGCAVNTKDIVELAGHLDVMAVRRKHHEAITWEYGNTILTAVEEQAETIAKALRAYAADAVATSPPLNVPTLSATERALKIAIGALREANESLSAVVQELGLDMDGPNGNALNLVHRALVSIETLVPGIVK